MKATNISDQLFDEYNRILSRLDREARRDRCKGDLFCGWDWPTLRLVKPNVYARLKEIEKDLRGMKSVGLLAQNKGNKNVFA